MRRSLLFPVCIFLIALTTGCSWDPVGISEPWQSEATQLPCNGHPELCDTPFDEVVFPTTHNAYNYETGVTQFFQPNQDFPIRRQLLDGVRGLMLDVWDIARGMKE